MSGSKRRITVEGSPTEVSVSSAEDGENHFLFFNNKWGSAWIEVSDPDLTDCSDFDLLVLYRCAVSSGKVTRTLEFDVALKGTEKKRKQSRVDENVHYFQELQRQCKFIRHNLDQIDGGDLDFHIPLAGNLRVLLCDRKHPVLLKILELLEVNRRVWGPPPFDLDETPGSYLWVGPLADRNAPAGPPRSVQYEIREFLDTPLGKVGGQVFTPKKLIKWTANREGLAHYDPKKPKTYRDLKSLGPIHLSTSADEAQRTLAELGRWVLAVSKGLLAYL